MEQPACIPPWRLLASALVAMLCVPCGAVNAASTNSCKLAQIADLQVNLDGRRTLVDAKINGAEARFLLDSGAFWSTLSLAATKQYKLLVNYRDFEDLQIQGAGGLVSAGVTHVKDLTIFGMPLKNMDFVVIAAQVDEGAVGLIGQNLLRYADIEYDLGHGRLKLFIPKKCHDSILAYWANPGDTLSVVDMDSTDVHSPHTMTTAYLNGEKIRVMLDTGASASMVTLRAARRAGLTPETAGVEPGGSQSGIGRRTIETWIGRFKSFKIGDEEVQNTRLRFGDLDLPVDMLLGADFFLSHRIMVSNSQDKLYISYGGGPVFDLRRKPSNPAVTADLAGATPANDDSPKDAPGYAARGAVFAARDMTDRALADLDRACELEPGNVDYLLARARLRLRAGQHDLAKQDFDRVLQIQPANVEAMLARAAQNVRQRDYAAAGVDLDRLDLLMPQAAEQRVELAQLYIEARRPEAAIPQLDRWINLHPDDASLPTALNDRCWALALVSRDPGDSRLDGALKDCNVALRRRPDSAGTLDSRGLVYLRKGKWDRAIDDYSAALAKVPKLAWSLYGRGIARIRKGLKAEGQADIDNAVAIAARVAEDASYYGIAP